VEIDWPTEFYKIIDGKPGRALMASGSADSLLDELLIRHAGGEAAVAILSKCATEYVARASQSLPRSGWEALRALELVRYIKPTSSGMYLLHLVLYYMPVVRDMFDDVSTTELIKFQYEYERTLCSATLSIARPHDHQKVVLANQTDIYSKVLSKCLTNATVHDIAVIFALMHARSGVYKAEHRWIEQISNSQVESIISAVLYSSFSQDAVQEILSLFSTLLSYKDPLGSLQTLEAAIGNLGFVGSHSNGRMHVQTREGAVVTVIDLSMDEHVQSDVSAVELNNADYGTVMKSLVNRPKS